MTTHLTRTLLEWLRVYLLPKSGGSRFLALAALISYLCFLKVLWCAVKLICRFWVCAGLFGRSFGIIDFQMSGKRIKIDFDNLIDSSQLERKTYKFLYVFLQFWLNHVSIKLLQSLCNFVKVHVVWNQIRRLKIVSDSIDAVFPETVFFWDVYQDFGKRIVKKKTLDSCVTQTQDFTSYIAIYIYDIYIWHIIWIHYIIYIINHYFQVFGIGDGLGRMSCAKVLSA